MGHNHVWVSKVGRWFSRREGGPLVLTGEEIVSEHYHLLAIGIDSTIDWRQTAVRAIEQIHRQGGVAIAAHPLRQYWPAYDAQATQTLDGAEVLHPIAYGSVDVAAQLRQFYERAPLTAIGDSDYHGLGPMGLCRTYVFTKEKSQPGILDAIRHGRTVVYGRAGCTYGDPDLIRLAAVDGRLPQLALRTAAGATQAAGFLGLFSRIAGTLGLTAAAIAGLWPAVSAPYPWSSAQSASPENRTACGFD